MVTNGKLKRGRPSIISEAIVASIVEKMRAGNYFESSVCASGVSAKTGFNWMNQGEKDDEANIDSLHRELYLSIKQAEAEAEIDDIRDIRNGCDNWQSKAWIRERRSRERWGRVDKHEVSGVLEVLVKWDGNNNPSGSTSTSTPLSVSR
ncbi:MAG: hypothetical protein MUP49_05665 [Dehalococcoidia bacterium]|nr:hypothetical protein [Dehalococcoidia bacterium]